MASVRLIVFTTPDCKPCQVLKPHLERYGGETGYQIEYRDANKGTKPFPVLAVPTVIVLKDNTWKAITGLSSDVSASMAKIRAAVAE